VRKPEDERALFGFIYLSSSESIRKEYYQPPESLPKKSFSITKKKRFIRKPPKKVKCCFKQAQMFLLEGMKVARVFGKKRNHRGFKINYKFAIRMNKACVACFVLVFAILCFGAKAQNTPAEARILFYNKDYKAVLVLTSGVNTESVSADSLMYFRAFAFNEMGYSDKALKTLKKLLKKYPNHSHAHFLKGNIHTQNENYPEAISAYNKTIFNDNNNLKAMYNLATAKGMLGDYKGAINDLTEYLKRDAECPDAFYSRGYWLEMQEDFEEALADYNKTLTLKPQMVEAYFSKAHVYYKMNNREQACQTLIEAEKTGSQVINEAKTIFCR
jgi:tetratricopeptide (TPR) repeat protein